MSVTLNMLFRSFEINPDEVRLLRHKDDKRSAPGRTPYDLWRDRRELFDEYQTTQSPKKRRGLASAKYWASFVATPAGETLFVGLYASKYAGLGNNNRRWPNNQSQINQAGKYDLYELALQPMLNDFDGKLVIDWGAKSERSWAQYAHRHDKQILELRRAFKEPEFPGCLNFVEPLSKIEGLPQDWKLVLKNSRGIYLLTCPKTKEQYVGKADGQEGFLQRWLEYARTGHGGNVKLKNREPSDYQVAILELGGTTFDFEKAEALWKQKLQTRQMGLNGN